jgi:hypothetical protein
MVILWVFVRQYVDNVNTLEPNHITHLCYDVINLATFPERKILFLKTYIISYLNILTGSLRWVAVGTQKPSKLQHTL